MEDTSFHLDFVLDDFASWEIEEGAGVGLYSGEHSDSGRRYGGGFELVDSAVVEGVEGVKGVEADQFGGGENGGLAFA